MNLKTKIYADGANIDEMLKAYRSGLVAGFTTNPTLMNKAGIKDYRAFAQQVCLAIQDLPISFEVFSDDFAEMKRQALEIAKFGANANIKIPITNTKGEAALPLIRELLNLNLKLNVTAIFTDEQLRGLRETMQPQDDVIVSIFAGRIADTGRDPMPIMKKAVQDFADLPKAKVLWASPREVLNVFQANDLGVHIITVTSDILSKLKSYNKDLADFSLETVKMFYDDACKSGFTL
jgi:transaldolase